MGVVVVIPYQAEPWHVSNVAFHLLVQEAVALVSVPTDEVTLIAAQANHGLHLDQMGTEERVRIARLLAAAARNLRQKLLCKSAPSEWELSYAAYLPVLEMWMDGLVSEEPGNH